MVLVFIVVLNIANAIQVNNTGIQLNQYFGGSGLNQNLGDMNVSMGTAQNMIGQYNTTAIVNRVGIFYMADISFTSPIFPFAYLIESFGIEWVAINWT